MTKQESTKPKGFTTSEGERKRKKRHLPSLPPHMFREAKRRRSPIPRLPSFLPFYFALCNVRRGRKKEGQSAVVSRRSSCFSALLISSPGTASLREGSGKPDPEKESVRARTHAAPSRPRLIFTSRSAGKAELRYGVNKERGIATLRKFHFSLHSCSLLLGSPSHYAITP